MCAVGKKNKLTDDDSLMRGKAGWRGGKQNITKVWYFVAPSKKSTHTDTAIGHVD